MSSASIAADIPLIASGLDRAGHRRRDQPWLDAAFVSDNARIMLMQAGSPLVEGRVGQQGPRPLLWLGPQAGMLAPRAPMVFLGETRQGSPAFALDMPEWFSLAASPIAGLGVFEDFRAAAAAMSPEDASAAATGRALFEWRRRHGYCSACGCRTEVREAGWKSQCPDCGVEHFPRVDPVAIMLAVRGDKCLLGRQAAWRPGFWSCLAGFVEPGETIEQAASRELLEEAGIVAAAGSTRYLFGQPWPFPSSLMIGLIMEAASEEIRVDPSELEDARWFSRSDIAAMMDGVHPSLFAPPRLAVAHHIIRAWLDGA